VDAALDNFEEALQLRLKYLDKINPYHPDIGISYQNLGKVNSKLSKHTDAQTNYSQAAQIYRHNYPQSHPLVIEITKCLKETQ
jgi:tetratricopeptide (TPR) repeat protein